MSKLSIGKTKFQFVHPTTKEILSSYILSISGGNNIQFEFTKSEMKGEDIHLTFLDKQTKLIVKKQSICISGEFYKFENLISEDCFEQIKKMTI